MRFPYTLFRIDRCYAIFQNKYHRSPGRSHRRISKLKMKTEFYTNKDKIHGSKCKECFNKLCIERQQANKIKMVEYCGGKCIICDYSETNSGLAFHHVNPIEKDLEIARLVTRSWENITSELDKCVLLCVRCHNELHHSHLSETHNKTVHDYYLKNKHIVLKV